MKYIVFFLGCLTSLPSLAQSDALNSVQTRAGTWQNVVLQEKVFVHIDKPFYLAGEIAWCRVYCVDGNTHRPQDVSKLAYVEFLDQENKSVLQGKIALENGFGEGSFYIPPAINTGVYRLRAYTNWMKNFGPQTFFEQPVTIVNTIKGVDTAALTRPDSVMHYSLRFFPEGGDLVAGLPSTVAFETLNNDGRGMTASGAIIDDNNDTLTTFQTQMEGMGVITFTPNPGRTYKGVLYCPDGIARTFPMPPVLPNGYTIHLVDNGGAILTLIVHASPGLAPQNTSLFVHSGTGAAFTGQIAMGSRDSAAFTISRQQLQEGNTRFTLFDASGRPRAERQYFLPPHSRLNITAATDKPDYATREKIRLDITTDTSAHLSIAVYRLDSLQGEPSTDIVRYLWTSSEWTGRIPSSRVFDDPALAGLYTLTHGWSRFLWSDVLTHPTGPHLYPPELRGQFITGRLTDPHNGTPAKDITTWLSTPGFTFQFAATQTDTAGKFQFDIKDFYGQDGIVIHTGTENYPYKVDIFTPFAEQYTHDYPPPHFHLTTSQLPLLTRHNIGMQVQNVYLGDSTKHFDAPRIDTTPFFGRGDYTYMLDNFVRFTSIEEVLREYVREINITRLQGHQHIVMLNEPMHATFTDNKTLILLDGIPVPNDRIFNYDPLKVKKLEVIPREYILGPSHFSGIASFTTFKGDYEGLELDSNSLQLEYEGLQYHREFYAPAYTNIRQTQNRLPDFRNVLYWSPDILAGTKPSPVEFDTSDLAGEYLIVIQGLSTNGRAGVTYKRFTVRPGPTAAR